MVPNVILAREFFPSLTKFQPNEQARVVQFVTQFQESPSHPSISLERLKAARGDLWSGRVSQELRVIIYKDGDTWALLHADHHDQAYAWAERRQVGRHSVTGALEVVDVVSAQEVRTTFAPAPDQFRPPGLFDVHRDEYLLSLGVPEAWLPAVREIRSEEALFTVCPKLPEDVAERLLAVAAGELVTPPAPAVDLPVQDAPDTGRRFFFVEDLPELRAALKAPLATWISFLHPSQKALVTGEFNGPVKVTGSAGTGKTVVALHRARALARKGNRVLLTSFVTTLCTNLQRDLEILCGSEALKRIRVSTVHAVAREMVEEADGRAVPAGADRVRELLDTVASAVAPGFDRAFVRAEWENVIQRQGIGDWPAYREASRVGRGRPLSVKDRKVLWDAFAETRSRLLESGSRAWSDLCIRATEILDAGEARSPFDAVVVDELQDLNAAEIRFLWALAKNRPGNFMVVGDAGQRIYAGGFSLKALGVEVRGRSHILRLNYRTTEQIRRAADGLLGDRSDDMDGGVERRDGTRSLLKGPEPELRGFGSWDEERLALAEEIGRWTQEGLAPEEIAIFTRTNQLAKETADALSGAGHAALLLDRQTSLNDPGVRIGSMHRAKGLEFKAVAVAGVSAHYLPHPRTLEGVTDPMDREDALAQERRLLYVAMTRARDELLVTWHGAPSSFLESFETRES